MNMSFIQANDNFDTKPKMPLDKCPIDRRMGITSSSPKAPMPYLLRLSRATHVTIDTLRSFPPFDPYENSSSTSSWNTGAFIKT